MLVTYMAATLAALAAFVAAGVIFTGYGYREGQTEAARQIVAEIDDGVRQGQPHSYILAVIRQGCARRAAQSGRK